MDLDHVITKSLVNRQKIERTLMLVFSLARRIYLLKNQVNFWNRMTFQTNALILLRGFKEPLSGTVEKISDCRAFRSVDNRTILQPRRVCPPKEQDNFWNRLTILSNHLIFPRSLKEP